MKILTLLLLSFCVLSCTKNAKTGLTDEQKSAIMAEITQQFDLSGQPPFVIAFTLLWRKEEEGWKLFHMHNSWE